MVAVSGSILLVSAFLDRRLAGHCGQVHEHGANLQRLHYGMQRRGLEDDNEGDASNQSAGEGGMFAPFKDVRVVPSLP